MESRPRVWWIREANQDIENEHRVFNLPPSRQTTYGDVIHVIEKGAYDKLVFLATVAANDNDLMHEDFANKLGMLREYLDSNTESTEYSAYQKAIEERDAAIKERDELRVILSGKTFYDAPRAAKLVEACKRFADFDK